MATERKEKDPQFEPLFTGNRLHDTSVSEPEKWAEAAQAIWSAVQNLIKKNRTR